MHTGAAVPLHENRPFLGPGAVAVAWAASVLLLLATTFAPARAVASDPSEEAPATQTEGGTGAPDESRDSNGSEEHEAAPRQERNGKGGRRMRGSDPYADRRVMNA